MTKLPRKQKGSFLAELPVAVYVFVLIFLMPMISLGTMGLRYTLLCVAAHDGARAASLQPTEGEAKTAAEAAVAKVQEAFPGMTPSAPTTDVASLDEVVDSTNTVRSYRVDVTATLDPLVKIPGIIDSFPIKVSSTKICENSSTQ